MSDEIPKIELPQGWDCRVELKPDSDGALAATAQLLQGREVRCVFVLAKQPSRDAALQRIAERADKFISEWKVRSRGTL